MKQLRHMGEYTMKGRCLATTPFANHDVTPSGNES